MARYKLLQQLASAEQVGIVDCDAMQRFIEGVNHRPLSAPRTHVKAKSGTGTDPNPARGIHRFAGHREDSEAACPVRRASRSEQPTLGSVSLLWLPIPPEPQHSPTPLRACRQASRVRERVSVPRNQID